MRNLSVQATLAGQIFGADNLNCTTSLRLLYIPLDMAEKRVGLKCYANNENNHRVYKFTETT